jgi:hypothetical protein
MLSQLTDIELYNFSINVALKQLRTKFNECIQTTNRYEDKATENYDNSC